MIFVDRGVVGVHAVSATLGRTTAAGVVGGERMPSLTRTRGSVGVTGVRAAAVCALLSADGGMTIDRCEREPPVLGVTRDGGAPVVDVLRTLPTTGVFVGERNCNTVDIVSARTHQTAHAGHH
jgi:hypothetical protein